MIKKIPNEYLSQYYAAFNVMQIISRTDTEGVILSANKNFCNISGYTEKELIGKKHNIVRHPDMKDAIFEKIWKTIKSGKIWKGEIKNSTKKGGFYWTRTTIFPLFDSNKKIVEYVSFREDITKRKLQDMKFLQERNYRHEILHAQPNMAILVHKIKGVIFLNKKSFENIPYDSRQDFLDKHECICELFLQRDGFLQQTTKERHWLEDFYENPEANHKAIMLNRENQEQEYDVQIKIMEENKNLIVVNFLKTQKQLESVEQSKEESDKIKALEMKILMAISSIASVEDGLDKSSEEFQHLEKVRDALS